MTGQVKFVRPAMLNVGSYWRATVLMLAGCVDVGDEDEGGAGSTRSSGASDVATCGVLNQWASRTEFDVKGNDD